MELITISKLSKAYGISTRTLRYYEEIGLITSIKKEDYAYRTYDENALRRLQQILILRKLRIKLSDIASILDNADEMVALEIFRESLFEVNKELDALSTIQKLYKQMIEYLSTNINAGSFYNLMELNSLIDSIDALSISKVKLKEEKTTMEDLNKASETISKLNDKDVRIIYIPSFTVASTHYIGENPEDVSGEMMDNFVRNYKLEQIKPDIRLFGFNNPCSTKPNKIYGYEFWITIPEEMDVTAPLEKKQFDGGLYATHCIKMGNFDEWKLLVDWVNDSNEYDYDRREPLGMDGSMEEHLNAYTYYRTDKENAKFKQLDLLIPIKLR